MSESQEQPKVDVNARAGSRDFERLLDGILSGNGRLYSLGNKNNSNRAAVIVKTSHGIDIDIERFRLDPELFQNFLKHQDSLYIALRQMSRTFTDGNRVRFILEGFHQSGPEWDAPTKEHLSAVANIHNQRRVGNTRPYNTVIQTLLNDPRRSAFLSALQGSVMFAAQCHVNDVPQLILSGKPNDGSVKTALSKTHNPINDITALAKEARSRTIDITEIEHLRDTWMQSTDEDHRIRHAYIQTQAKTVSDNSIAVCVIGGDHVACGYHETERSVSRDPLEKYLEDDFQLFVYEPQSFKEAAATKKKENQLQIIPANMTVEEIKTAISILLRQQAR